MKTPHCIIAVVILLSIISGCSKQDNNPISVQKNDEGMLLKTLEEQEAKLCILAQQLAVSLNNKDIIDLLKHKFETVNSRESILIFSDLLSENVNGVTFLEKITSNSLKSKYNLESILTEAEINDLINSFDHGLDFYFPVVEHKESWKSNINRILVAYPPFSINDDEWEKIIAYNLKGDKKILNAKIPPQEPVLMITPCEHHGDHSIASNNALRKTLSTTSGVWRMTILDFLLFDDHESWPLGDAEIYVKLLDGGHWYSTDCPDINHEGSYYNCDIPIDPAWVSQPSGLRYFEVWEEDDTSADDLVEKYWHWPYESSAKTRNVNLEDERWYYGDNDDADVYMRVLYY